MVTIRVTINAVQMRCKSVSRNSGDTIFSLVLRDVVVFSALCSKKMVIKLVDRIRRKVYIWNII